MEPRRQGSPRHIQQGSPHHSRQGSPHHSRQGSPHPSRQGSPHRSVHSPPQRVGSSERPVGSLATSSCHPGSRVSITFHIAGTVPSTSTMSLVKPLDSGFTFHVPVIYHTESLLRKYDDFGLKNLLIAGFKRCTVSLLRVYIFMHVQERLLFSQLNLNAFHFNSDPDPDCHFNANPIAICDHWSIDNAGSILSFQAFERPRPSNALFLASKAFNFDFNADDPDPL
jgi:hypothetical protein